MKGVQGDPVCRNGGSGGLSVKERGIQVLGEVGWGSQGIPVPRKGGPGVPSAKERGVTRWGDLGWGASGVLDKEGKGGWGLRKTGMGVQGSQGKEERGGWDRCDGWERGCRGHWYWIRECRGVQCMRLEIQGGPRAQNPPWEPARPPRRPSRTPWDPPQDEQGVENWGDKEIWGDRKRNGESQEGPKVQGRDWERRDGGSRGSLCLGKGVQGSPVFSEKRV